MSVATAATSRCGHLGRAHREPRGEAHVGEDVAEIEHVRLGHGGPAGREPAGILSRAI